MVNKFVYSNDNKRYHTFNYYLKNKYGSKVFKVSLNANFSCPNRDGSKGIGGCTFCSSTGSGDFAGKVDNTLLDQFETIKTRMHIKWPQAKYIAYFQAYTNTYAPLDILKKTYQPFIEMEDVKVIDIATRPDCLDENVIAYLDEIAQSKEVWVELGLQTTYDDTAINFNRAYEYQVFLDAIDRLSKTKIKVCVHIINGFRGESSEMMINNVKRVGQLKIHGIKIHMLHIIKNTQLAKEYMMDSFTILTLDEYVATTVNQLRYLPEHIIVQRLTGDANKDDLIVPEWTLNKTNVLNSIDKYMALHGYYQGDLVK